MINGWQGSIPTLRLGISLHIRQSDYGWVPSLSRRLVVFHFEEAANAAKGDWIERYELLHSKPPQ